MLRIKRNVVAGVIALLLAFIVDQGTKALVVANAAALKLGIPVVPGFNLIFLRNDGVSFGLLGAVPWWGLVALALGICSWLLVLLARTGSATEALAYGAIIGGALGNVVDRVRYHAVTDFLDFYIGITHWPAFNMADVFVVSGVGVLVFMPWMGAGMRRLLQAENSKITKSSAEDR
ncbi:MAG: signal peptidase II [Pseudomonadota bacterium]